MNKVRVSQAIGMGRGVFASKPIKSRAIIFAAHTWTLTKTDINVMNKTSIAGNYFENPFNENECLLALGDLSLINHSSTPNAEVDFVKTKNGVVIKCLAARNIKQGEQLFIDYGPDHEYGKS